MQHQPVILQNDKVRCVIDAAAAAVVQLFLLTPDGTAQPLCATGNAREPLFRLNWNKPWQERLTDPPAIHEIAAEAVTDLVTLQVDENAGRGGILQATYRVCEPEGPETPRRQALVRLRVELPAGSSELSFSLEVTNQSATETITEILFPILSGVSIEPAPENESLLYPYVSGVRLRAPRVRLLEGRSDPDAAPPLTPTAAADGSAVVRHTYCGRLSMTWMAVEGVNKGLAVLHYNREHDVTGFFVVARAAQAAAVSPGLDLAASTLRPLAPGERRCVPPSGVMCYLGTWHQAADRYRAWISDHWTPPRVPRWVRESHALTAHYDFKWGDGTHTHTFADIPALWQRSAAEGIHHLLLAGWFTGGFDHMYPEFYPDLDLGTVMDFVDATRAVTSAGGKVTYYINTSLFGKASRYFDSLGRAWAVKGSDGELVPRRFFGHDFVVACRGAAGYRKHMVDTVRWLLGEVGATGVYLDTFAAIGPHLCHDPEHRHPHFATWNQDALDTIRAIEEAVRSVNPDAFTMFECCSDIYGQWVAAQLIQGWYYRNSYPELFRYTFPECVLVDMVYPSQGQTFRPQRISDEAYDQLHRTFVNGCLIWVYDQEDERYCTFRTDPKMWAHIKQILSLRERGKEFFGYGRFRDTQGLRVEHEAVTVKRYTRELGRAAPAGEALEMFAVWNRGGKEASFTIDAALVREWCAARSSGQAADPGTRPADAPHVVTGSPPRVIPDDAPCGLRFEMAALDGSSLEVQAQPVEGGLKVVLPAAPVCLLFVYC